MFHSVIERIARAVEATSAYLVWCDWERDTGTIMAEYFGPQANAHERLSDHGRNAPPERVSTHAGSAARSTPFDHTAKPGRCRSGCIDNLRRYGGKSSLRVPLSTASQTLGYVVIWDSRVERVWTDSEIRVCQTLANQAAVALENVQLYETTQRRTMEQGALLEASRAISSTLDLPTMLQRLAEQMGRASMRPARTSVTGIAHTDLRHSAGRVLRPGRRHGRTRL